MNELKRHKKSDKIKWVVTGIAFVLVFVMLIGMCLQLFGTGKVKPSEWFKKSEQTTSIPMEDKDTDNNGMVVTPANSRVMKLAAKHLSASLDDDNYAAPEGVGTYANANSYTLTATIEPADATNNKVDWSVKLKSGGDASEYVTIATETDGALTATLTCLNPFGEQIIVTCVSRDNSEAKATCTLDYIKRVNNVTLNVSGLGVTGGMYGPKRLISGKAISIGYTVTYGVGTLSGTFSGGVIQSSMVDGLKSACAGAVSASYVPAYSTTFVSANLTSSQTATCTVGDSFAFTSVSSLGNNKGKWSSAFYNYVSANSSVALVTLSMPYTYSYAGHNQADKAGTASLSVSLEASSFLVAVDTVTVSESSFLF